jgi:phosphopentomutase
MESKMTKKKRVDELHGLTRAFCKDHLTEEYRSYVDRLINMLDNSKYDLEKGNIKILASAAVCVVARLNLLFDKKSNDHITIGKICDYYGTKKITIEKKAKEMESVCNIMLGHEGLCKEEISDALTFLQFEDGTVITKAMAKEHGIL